MRRFQVTIGGVTYHVEVEEVGAPAPAPAAPAAYAPAAYAPAPAPAAAPAAQPAPRLAPAPEAPKQASAPSPIGGGETVTAPLPGMVVGLKVEVGQAVQPGEVLLVLEAMKMENDIVAPVAGKVQQVLVSRGTTVAHGDPLVIIG